jgi:hypothetical protein
MKYSSGSVPVGTGVMVPAVLVGAADDVLFPAAVVGREVVVPDAGAVTVTEEPGIEAEVELVAGVDEGSTDVEFTARP